MLDIKMQKSGWSRKQDSFSVQDFKKVTRWDDKSRSMLRRTERAQGKKESLSFCFPFSPRKVLLPNTGKRKERTFGEKGGKGQRCSCFPDRPSLSLYFTYFRSFDCLDPCTRALTPLGKTMGKEHPAHGSSRHSPLGKVSPLSSCCSLLTLSFIGKWALSLVFASSKNGFANALIWKEREGKKGLVRAWANSIWHVWVLTFLSFATSHKNGVVSYEWWMEGREGKVRGERIRSRRNAVSEFCR